MKLNKCQLDDELGWHSQEYYDNTPELVFRGQSLRLSWADYWTETWGYEVV